MDVVTIGETMVLFIPNSIGPLRYMNQFERTIGGAESNVAIGLSRLGHQVGWISKLGNDEFGLYVRNYIRGEGVDTSHVLFDQNYPTAIFFKERQAAQEPKIFYYRKNSAASSLTPTDLDEEYIARAKYLHITGITPALSSTCQATIDYAIEIAKKHGLTVVFDPNIRLKLWSQEDARRVLINIAARCDIILPGIEEGQILTGKSSPESIANDFLSLGIKLVVLKLGARGAYYATAQESKYIQGIEVNQVVDPIGAGDAFAAGLISGFLREWGIEDSVQLANRVAAYALTVPGDVEGLPFWSQVDQEKGENIIRR